MKKNSALGKSQKAKETKNKFPNENLTPALDSFGIEPMKEKPKKEKKLFPNKKINSPKEKSKTEKNKKNILNENTPEVKEEQTVVIPEVITAKEEPREEEIKSAEITVKAETVAPQPEEIKEEEEIKADEQITDELAKEETTEEEEVKPEIDEAEAEETDFIPFKPKKRKLIAPTLKFKSKEFEKELRKIYQDDKGKLPPMTSLEFNKKRTITKVLAFIIISLGVIFAAAFAGLLLFQPASKFTGEKLNLEIKAPFSAASGEKMTYLINYYNQEDISLTKNSLTVYLPQGFIYESASSEPLPQEGTAQTNIKTWPINDLLPKQQGGLEIKGTLIANINSKQTISATLSYTPANFNSEFQKSVSFNTEVAQSLLDWEIKAPNQTNNESEANFSLILTNKSPEIDLNNIQIEVTMPREFTLAESQITDVETEEAQKIPQEEKDGEITLQKTWTIDKLPAQKQKRLDFKGKFTIEENKKLEFNFKAKIKGVNDEYYLQKEETISIDALKGELLTDLIINGSNQNQAVNFSDPMNYLLTVKNKSKKALGDVKIRFVSDSPFLDWDSLKDENKGIREDNQILWTKEQIQKLNLILPEEELEIKIQINLKNADQAKQYKPEERQIKSFFEAQVNEIDSAATDIVIESNTIINEINTDLTLQASARYYDNNSQAIGSGPIPPKVGEKTTYKIYWTLSNSLNELQNIEIKAKLPDYASLGNKNASAGNIFVNQSNEVVWQISRIPNTIDKSTAELEISITPKQENIDKILTILPEINLQATDTVTNSRIDKNTPGLTTNLEGDPLAEGKGLVQE